MKVFKQKSTPKFNPHIIKTTTLSRKIIPEKINQILRLPMIFIVPTKLRKITKCAKTNLYSTGQTYFWSVIDNALKRVSPLNLKSKILILFFNPQPPTIFNPGRDKFQQNPANRNGREHTGQNTDGQS